MRKLLAICALSILTGCAAIGIPQPESFNEKLAVAYGSVTVVRMTTTSLLQTKQIDADDAQNVQDGADNLRKGLDVARKLSGTLMSSAVQKLDAVVTSIRTLKTYVDSKRGGN